LLTGTVLETEQPVSVITVKLTVPPGTTTAVLGKPVTAAVNVVGWPKVLNPAGIVDAIVWVPCACAAPNESSRNAHAANASLPIARDLFRGACEARNTHPQSARKCASSLLHCFHLRRRSVQESLRPMGHYSAAARRAVPERCWRAIRM